MDIHTVCCILQHRTGNDPDIDVRKLVGLARASQGERYEIAIYNPDPDDAHADNALDHRTDTQGIDPLAADWRFDPRDNPYQGRRDRPNGGGYYVGIRAVHGAFGPRSFRSPNVRATL